MDTGLASTLALALHILLVVGAFVVVPVDRKPSSATAWLLLITAAPFLGVILFLLVGSPKLPERRRKLQRQMTGWIQQALAADAPLGWARARDLGERFGGHAALAERLGGMPVMAGNRIEILHGYDAIIAELVGAVETARHDVHVEFYITALDATTEPLVAALEAAVDRGVCVRLLFDQVGSRKFPRRREMQERLTRAGIAWRAMLPILNPREWLRIDLRNHRKILVVDNAVAFTGSLNLITGGYHRTDDLHYEELCARITGPAVLAFGAVFVTDWYSETGEVLQGLHQPEGDVAEAGGSLAQVLPSGSGFDEENNLRLFTEMMYAARSTLIVATPYFVPDDSLLIAITSAAQRGVKVTLINSEAVDQTLVVHAQRSFYEELLRAGVEVRLYPAPVLLHAKATVVDDDIAVLGSSNMDLRSFTLNMEVSLILYGQDTVSPLKRVIDDYAAQSRPLEALAWSRRSWGSRIVENLARLTAALQ